MAADATSEVTTRRLWERPQPACEPGGEAGVSPSETARSAEPSWAS
jgi:hypothetical protein